MSNAVCVSSRYWPDISEVCIAYIKKMARIGELKTTLALPSNRSTLRKNSVRLLLVTANVVTSSSIFVTLVMEWLLSSETSVVTIATRCKIPKEGILHTYYLPYIKRNQRFKLLDTTKDCRKFPSHCSFEEPTFRRNLAPPPPPYAAKYFFAAYGGRQ
jgi:hypothetical protein